MSTAMSVCTVSLARIQLFLGWCVVFIIYFQVITKCCCYLRTMRYNLSAFDEYWEGCAKAEVKECTDEKSGKRL